MANAGMFFSIIVFMLIFNGLVGMYAVSETNIDDIGEMPSLDKAPGLLDYLSYPFEWVFFTFGLVGFTITELPIWLSGLVVALDLTLAYIIVAMIRGN